MSLINREDLIAEYDRVHVGAPGGARKLMVDAPEVKSEIVRCKDCKYYDPNDHCYLQGAEADDFCSYAERKTDGTEQP